MGGETNTDFLKKIIFGIIIAVVVLFFVGAIWGESMGLAERIRAVFETIIPIFR